jgi:ribosomal protein S18 acetylase RimI-like enzyme
VAEASDVAGVVAGESGTAGTADAAARGSGVGAAGATAGALTIRVVRPEEYDEAGRVTADAYAASYGDLSEAYLASLRDVGSRVADGDVWIAVDEAGSILGTVWVAPEDRPLSHVAEPGETDFRQLAVAPQARGRGVGAALTLHVVALAAERGSHRVVMNSGPQMTGAHALYAKLGFSRLRDRERPLEVEPGRWIDLLAFGRDI